MNEFNEITESNNYNPSSPGNINISYYNNQSPSNISYPIDYNDNSINNSNYNGVQNKNQQQNWNINQYENMPQTPKMPLFMDNGNINSDEPIKNNKTQPDSKNIEITQTNDNSKSNFMEAPELVCKIENIVSTANLNCNLNLKEIALQLGNSTYNPKRFSGLIVRLKNLKTTALIFSNGKMVCVGAKSEEISREASRLFGRMIKKINNNVTTLSKPKIQNVVGSADLKMKISLIKLYHYLAKYNNDKQMTYEPELFPGLIYHLAEPKIVLLIFSSGKMVLTGGKKKEDIYEGFEKITSLLVKFKSK